jgi:hypothetical protein
MTKGYLQTLEPSERSRIAKMGVEARRAKKADSQYVRFGDTINVSELDLYSNEALEKLENACLKFLATKNASKYDLPFVKVMLEAIDSVGARREHHEMNEKFKAKQKLLEEQLTILEQKKHDQEEK